MIDPVAKSFIDSIGVAKPQNRAERRRLAHVLRRLTAARSNRKMAQKNQHIAMVNYQQYAELESRAFRKECNRYIADYDEQFNKGDVL